jgi:chitodextrinase
MKKNIFGFVLVCLAVPSIVYAGFSQDLSYGKQGDEVTLLQQFLREKGYYDGPVSGGFYSLTKSALITFQKSLKIEPATGFFGPITRNVVNYMLQSGDVNAASFITAPVYQAPPTTTQPPTQTNTTNTTTQTASSSTGTPFATPPVFQAPPTTQTPTIPTSTTTDTKPPIIISLSVSSVTATGAVIFWTTDESSDALVEYGLTSSLGSQGPFDPTSTSKHNYTLSGLTPNTTYNYRVRSKDASGNLVVSSIGTFKTSASTVTVTDTIPPTVPTGLKVVSTESTKAMLSWNASTDAVGVSQYRVYRGGTQITSVNTTTYTDTGLSPSTSYQYQVAALDTAGNLSALSSPSVSVMTAAATKVATTTPVGMFKIGDTARTTTVTAIRTTAVLTAPILTTVPVSSIGTVTSGPVVVTGGTFWKVKYDIGAEGWSLESSLVRGIASPLDLSVSELNFGNTDISVKNPDKVLTVTNVSSAPVSIYGISVSGAGYKITQSTCTTLSPKASCEISVSFSPKTTVQSVGSLTISHTAPGSPVIVPLFGVGLNGDTISGKMKTTTSGLATADMVSGGGEGLFFDYIKPTGSAPFGRYMRGEEYRILSGVTTIEGWFFDGGGAPVPCHPLACFPVTVPEHMPTVWFTIDGVRVTGPQTLPYKFTLDTTKYADGVHILGAEIVSDDVPVVPVDISIIIDNVPGPVLGKQKFPNCTTKFGITHGGAAYGCEWINYDPSVKFTGSPQTEPRVPTPFSTNPSSSELWAERMITTGRHIPRVLETPEGHPIISNKQQYYYWDISGLKGEEAPNLASIDGPRNVGTTGYIVDGYVDPTYHTLYAVSTHGRIVKVTPEGDVETIAGWRVKPGGVPPHGASGRADKADEYEIVGNFVDGPKNLFEPWGIVRDPRVTSANVFFVTDTLNHRIVKIDMRTSPATVTTYAGSLTKTSGYKDGIGTAALFNEPWGIAITPDGTLYVTDRLNHALRKVAPDGTVSTIFRSTRLAPTDGIGPGNRTPYRAGSLVPPARDAYMKDGSFDTATLVYPEALKFDSMGRLIVSENLIMALRRIDLTKRTIEWVSEVPLSTVGAGMATTLATGVVAGVLQK